MTFYIFKYLIILFIISSSNAHANNMTKKCGDAACHTQISKGKTIQRYPSNSKNKLSCKVDENVIIFAKIQSNDKTQLWEVELNGKRGILPAKFIKEDIIFIKDNKLIDVPMESSNTDKEKKPDIKVSDDWNYEKMKNENHYKDPPDEGSYEVVYIPAPEEANENQNAESNVKSDNNTYKEAKNKDIKQIDLEKKPVEQKKDFQMDNGEILPNTHKDPKNIEDSHIDKSEKESSSSDYSASIKNQTVSLESVPNSNAKLSHSSKNIENNSQLLKSNLQPQEQKNKGKIESKKTPDSVDSNTDQLVSSHKISPSNTEDYVVVSGTKLPSDIVKNPEDVYMDSMDSTLQKSPYSPLAPFLKTVLSKSSETSPMKDNFSDNFDIVGPHKNNDVDFSTPKPSSLLHPDESMYYKENLQSEQSKSMPAENNISSSNDNKIADTNETISNSSTSNQNELLKSSVYADSKKQGTGEQVKETIPLLSKLLDPKLEESAKYFSGADRSNSLPVTHESVQSIEDSTESSPMSTESAKNVQDTTDTSPISTEVRPMSTESIQNEVSPMSTESIQKEESPVTTETTQSGASPVSTEPTQNVLDTTENSNVLSAPESKIESGSLNILGSLFRDSENSINREFETTDQPPFTESTDAQFATEESTENSEDMNDNDTTEQPNRSLLSDDTEKLKQTKENLPFSDPDEALKPDIIDDDVSSDEWFMVNFTEYLRPYLGDDIMTAFETELKRSPGTLLLLIIISFTIFFIYSIHLLTMKLSREKPLLHSMNNIVREMRLTKNENLELKKRLDETSTHSVDPEIAKKSKVLEHQLTNLKEYHERNDEDQRNKITQLEQEIEESTSHGEELSRMLEELLQNQKDSSNLNNAVDSLQNMLDGQREKVESLTADLALKTRLNDELRTELKMSKNKSAKLEYQIEQLSNSLEEANSSKSNLTKSMQSQTSSLSDLEGAKALLTKELENANAVINRLTEQVKSLETNLSTLKSKLNMQDAQIRVTKSCCEKLQKKNKDVSLEELFHVIEVKSTLLTVQKENKDVNEQLARMNEERDALNVKLVELSEQLVNMKELQDKALTEKDDALSKLNVLTNYFKEKEAQLTKELESQESLRLSAEGNVTSTSNKIHNFENELATSRSLIETLKIELEEQKQSYKMQLSNEEKKSHENWLSARSAERRQEELRKENSHLRQRITMISRDHENMLIKPVPKRVETNGSASSPASTDGDLDRSRTSPLDMDHLPPPLPMHPMLPPPMFPGGPPPPMPPPFMGLPPHCPPPMPDRRMPPAGRIASPPFRRPGSPFNRSYSPASDYSGRYSPPTSGRYSPSGQRRQSPARSNHSGHNYSSKSEQSHYDSRSDHSRKEYEPEFSYRKSRNWSPRSPENSIYYNESQSSDSHRAIKGQKTSTPVTHNDR